MLFGLNLRFFFFSLIAFFYVNNIIAQDAQPDLGEIDIPNPSSFIENYEYDASSDLYYFNVSVGEYDISYPIILTPEEYQQLILKEDLKNYYNAAHFRMDS